MGRQGVGMQPEAVKMVVPQPASALSDHSRPPSLTPPTNCSHKQQLLTHTLTGWA